MKYLSIVLVLCGSLAMLFSGCKNSSDLASPAIVTVPADFSVNPTSMYSSADPIAFATGSAPYKYIDTVYATLSSAVSWNVDFLGLTSGAQKRVSGLSSDVKALWNGGNDGIYFFKSGEQVLVTLSFYGTDLSLVDTVTILTAKRYGDLDYSIGTPSGFLVTDFEVGPQVLPPAPPGGAWFNYHDPFGSPGVPGPDAEQDSNKVSSFLNAVQGHQFYYFEGTDRPALSSAYSTFFIMGAGFSQGTPLLDSVFKYHPNNTQDLFFNVYVYGFGMPNTKFQVSFDEDDNSSGLWSDATEDELLYVTRVDWVGWKLISFRYTDTKFSNIDPNGGAHGNHIREPEKIVKMGFGMNSDPALMHAKVAFDFPCFTYGHPFNPNN
jgi:hypothetical protein